MVVTPTSSQRKRDRVHGYLERELASIQPGAPLPSMRQMMEACQVSQALLASVLEEWKAVGRVVASSRRGLFKGRQANASASADVDVLDILYCRDRSLAQDGYHGELLEALTCQCLEAIDAGPGWQAVRVSYPGYNASESQLAQLVDERGCRSCLLVSNCREGVEASVFAPRRIPVVNLLPLTHGHPPHSVALDPCENIRLQLDHLWSLGHRRIAYLHTQRKGVYHPVQAGRREWFLRLMLERGARVPTGWVGYAVTEREIFASVDGWFAASRPPTAAIVADAQLPALYSALGRRGREVGHSFSVVATDDMPVAAMMSPPATSLRNSRMDAARLALDMLRQLQQGRAAPDLMYVPSRLIDRRSTHEISV